MRIDAPIEFFEALKSSKSKTLTFGIEAASYSLRKKIGKNIPDDLIFERISLLSGYFETLKLYFMIGLPEEGEEDIEAFDEFVRNIADTFKGKRISLSISPFVPKPFTPFEREPFDGVSRLKNKIKKVRKLVSSVRTVYLNYDLPKWSELQTIISRGDRRVGLYIAGAVKRLEKERYLGTLNGRVLPWSFISII